MDRLVKVYDRNKTHEWRFTHDPDVDATRLKELTKQCHLATHPDCEYSMSVHINGNGYYMTTDGDDAVVIVSMLCIMLEDNMLETILATMDCGYEFFQYCIPPYEPVNEAESEDSVKTLDYGKKVMWKKREVDERRRNFEFKYTRDGNPKNKVRCKKCGDIIIWDQKYIDETGVNAAWLIYCKCGETAVDPTPRMTRIIGNCVEMLDENSL